MSITFKQTIIHVLDREMGMPLLSTELFPLNNEIEDFVTHHLIKLFESSVSSEACFNPGASLPAQFEQPLSTEDFIALSGEIATAFYNQLLEETSIASGDLVLTSFVMDGNSYFGLLKLNYKCAYTHFVKQETGQIVTQIIKNKGIFPSSNKQVDEGLIVNTETLQTVLIDNSKSKYLASLFDLSPALSVKESIKAIEKVAHTLIEEHYDNPVAVINEFKHNITHNLSKTQSIPVEEVMAQTFSEDKDILETCMQHLETAGLKEATIPVSDPKIANKYALQKLKTDTDIEIKLPIERFNDPDFIEITNHPNGTLSITLKNISKLINK